MRLLRIKEPHMLGLTTLGTFHTAFAVIAVIAAIACFVRDKQIRADTRLGVLYISITVLTCLTALGIFRHGAFGKPHVLSIVTLIVLGVAALAGRTRVFGGVSREVEIVSYSATFFFHLIPGITEASTRLPLGAPLLASADAPELKAAGGVLFLLFVIGAVLQVRYFRARREPAVALSVAKT
jgi:uncharacterized membrane protein